MNKKILFFPPLLAAFVSFIFFSIYLLINSHTRIISEGIIFIPEFIWSTLKIFPLVFVIFSLIAYFLYFTVGYLLLKIRNEFLWSTGTFWFFSFLASFIVGLIIVLVGSYYSQPINKLIFILLSFSFGGLFCSSLFTVLNGEIHERSRS